ncbi:MAG: choice-of-anchor J domain-containing protein [Ginsengibacter sp.]
MKRSLFFAITLLFISHNSFSQQTILGQPPTNNTTEVKRCATMDRVEMLFKKFPERKLLAEKLAREIPPANSLRTVQRLTTVVYVPIVFHIVLSNPYLITDDVIQSQIDALNTDFAGLNADSTNIPAAFQAVRGHSLIQFVLAKRTPSGTFTNGVERITSSTTANPNNVTDSIKRASLGGADAWNPNSYINVWVGDIANNLGILGYTQVPGSGIPVDDGIFCNRIGFGISSCNASVYNKGRTLVHEMGHYFGINHIWGDDETQSNKCSGDDFRAMTDDGSSFVLPVTLYNPHGMGNTSNDIGDTPNQSIASNNCATGTVTDACSSSAPGIMYQDYMDYTMDNCYSMFTNQQVARMEYVLSTYRTGLINSSNATPPAGSVTRDASPIAAINPGGIETSGCSSIYHPSILTCAGNITPEVLIRNNGLNTITSITVGYTLNGGTPVTINLTPSLVFGNTLMVSFPIIAVNTGSYTFKFFTKNVNGSGNDQVTSNDTLAAALNVPSPVALPLSEGFEGTTFPPTGWSLLNLDNGITWQTTTPGNNSAHSMYINNYDDNSSGQIDEIRTPKLTFSSTDPIAISFDLAHKNYPDASFNDRLQVLVSNDCGATFSSYFDKAGAALATAGSTSDSYLNPATGDWKTQKIILDGSFLNNSNIIVAFRNTSDWGNNIYIDNINIQQVTSRDLSVIAVNPPTITSCEEPTTPVATIINNGLSSITGFKVSYTIDNGAPLETSITNISLAPNAQMNVPLNTFTPTGGQHIITVYTSQPVSSSGTGDESPGNDTTRKSFFAIGNVTPPVTEGFENTAFPPATWALENPDGGITWERTTTAAKTGAAAMVIRNHDYASTGTTDKFISSVVTETSPYDSMYVAFDYAYAPGNSTPPDTLEIQATTDCGQTFITLWKNWGTGLQTAGNTSGATFTPNATGDWANVNINLFNYVGSQNFQIYFVAKSNGQNNLYIDNTNIYGVTLPALLKQQGYLIYPNPFKQQFLIRNYQVPVTLRSAHIYNSMGQLIWTKEYNGNAYTQMPVNLGNAPSGIYFLKLQYTDKSVVQKIIKE